MVWTLQYETIGVNAQVYFVTDFSGTPHPFKATGELSFTMVEAEAFLEKERQNGQVKQA